MYHTLFSLFIFFLQAGSSLIEDTFDFLFTSPTFTVTTVTASLITVNRHPTANKLKRSASYPPHNSISNIARDNPMKIIDSSKRNSNLVSEFEHIGQYLHTIEENKQVNKLPEHAASSSSSQPPPVPPKTSGINWRFVSWNNASLSSRASSPFKEWRVSKNNTVRKSTASSSSSSSATTPSLSSTTPSSTPSSSCGSPNQKKECMICFDDFEEKEIFHTSQCQHYMCRQCLTTYLTTYTEARHDDYSRIPCPGHQCKEGSFDSQDIVSRVMSPTAADAWWFKIIRRDVLESYVS